ncbi:hypothetical protein P3X46_028460 [Hevea brasiliensis]|uniref:Leucine-rich repeat-containing N-terminal plant-type domain-containing protein n=2 Tax=Hevea brasiliensis TaxID=3981 RepID=A0ABQ9KP25_HEVBR|nr:hypothetical protein P3X46_028460 [Hevea brasiliensis]
MMITRKRSLQELYMCTVFVFLVHMKPAIQLNTGIGNGNGGGAGIGCIERERQALLRIKGDLIDDGGVLSSWGTGEDKRDCCKWERISCSHKTGHVTELDLNFNDIIDTPLRGKISHSLLELRHLAYLDLSYNDFGGTHFPLNNSSLTKLRYLSLSTANLALNFSSLGNFSGLQFLDLSYNNFHYVRNTEWLFGLSSLSFLDLSGNLLNRPNDWLQIVNKLPNLESLILSSCFSEDWIALTLSPINSSSSLATLDLSYNDLVIPSIQTWLSNISQNIIELDLSSNTLPGSNDLALFGNMISLQWLSLDNITLVGGIPKSFGNMSQLRGLYLMRNNLKMQLPDLIQNLSGCAEKSLEALNLHGNEITGTLPDLTRFSSLALLNLGTNSLNGTIDKSIGRLTKLRILDLSGNSLYGVISEDHFLNLSNLKGLSLAENSFIWNVSLHWVPPFHLYKIHLRSCKMGPHFPKWLQSQKNYTELDISNAGISDSIPKWFWNLSFDSFYLNISQNNLSGMVPDFRFRFSYFPVIDMSSNHLYGPLPVPLFSSKEISLAKFLEPNSISSNGDAISQPLIYLDLSNNLFSGVLPNRLTHLQDLIFLNLANNHLSGKIPASIGLLSKLETLNLGNNAFLGEIPLSLKNCTRLRFLDLSGNKLSGNIPTWIGESLSSLQFLSLQSNQFHGNIPLQLCQLTNVQILDLSANNINGAIPHCLKNLRAMYEGISTATMGDHYVLSQPGLMMYPLDSYIDTALILWKGKKYTLDKNLGMFRIIDISRNKIEGEIPREMSSLSKLNQLNLSYNKLSGAIPEEIGCLKQLESLDLSQNQLTGRLPPSMADLKFLSTLNLSYNNLSGRIPLSTQLQSFKASSFSNNPALCGLPLLQKCPGDNIQESQSKHDGQYNHEDGDEYRKWFYVGMGLGFSVGFWVVAGALLLKRSWRHAYFQALDKLGDWVYVRKAVYMRRLQQKFHS